MKFLFNKQEPNRAIMIATNKDDEDSLQFLFDNHMCFGFYQLSHRVGKELLTEDGEQPSAWIEILEKKYGIIALAIGHFHFVEGFVPIGETREIPPKQKITPEIIQDLFNFLG